MRDIESILKAYDAGALTCAWAACEIACSIRAENVEQVMSRLPREILREMSDWKGPGSVIGSNLSAADKEKKEASLKAIFPLIQHWLAQKPKVKV